MAGMYVLHEKEPLKPPEHTSEHVKSQNFLGACTQTPLKQSMYLCWVPTILLAALPTSPKSHLSTVSLPDNCVMIPF